MDPELLKLAAQYGAIGLFAGLTLYISSKQGEKHEQNWREISERWEEMSADLREVVRSNTASFVKALEAINTVQKQIDQMRWDGSERRRRTPGA